MNLNMMLDKTGELDKTAFDVFKLGVLKNFVILTGNHLRARNYIKKRLQHRCFPVKIAKSLEHIRRLSLVTVINRRYFEE